MSSNSSTQARIIVALDCDTKGRAASQKLVSQLRTAGYTAYAVDLNLGAGGDIADYCKLYQHESMAANPHT
jgi:hypothetical protein